MSITAQPTMTLHEGDCLAILPTIADGSIDLVAADNPYQSTRCQWDSLIPLAPLWDQYRRVLKPGGAIVLTADFRFATKLVATCPKGWFRYDLVWDKTYLSGFLDAKRRPLRRHEFILVFGPETITYHPQMAVGQPFKGAKKWVDRNRVYGVDHRCHIENTGTRYPSSILNILGGACAIRPRIHPTEKPTALWDWLIRTYSDPGDTVLDNAFGSCSSGEAAYLSGRHYIGIELDPGYYLAGSARLARIAAAPTLNFGGVA